MIKRNSLKTSKNLSMQDLHVIDYMLQHLYKWICLLSYVYLHSNSIGISLINITHSNCTPSFCLEPQVPKLKSDKNQTWRLWSFFLPAENNKVRLHSESWDFGIKGVFKNTAKSLLRKTHGKSTRFHPKRRGGKTQEFGEKDVDFQFKRIRTF